MSFKQLKLRKHIFLKNIMAGRKDHRGKARQNKNSSPEGGRYHSFNVMTEKTLSWIAMCLI